MRRLLLVLLLGLMTIGASAQRVIDKLDRGLVAVPQGDKTGQDSRFGMTGSGIFVSWRILPTEYYDTKYNLYRGSTKIASDLTVSNYQDNSGTKSSIYKVVPVVKGVEKMELAAECNPWNHQYWEIPVKPVVNRNGATVEAYSLNDCSVADVDGDGQMEFVVKRRNDSGNLRLASNKTDFNLHECYKMDGTRLWWIDMGPNLMSGPDEQFDLVLYDWDQDGKAEGIMRGADNMIIHTATGKTIKIGNMSAGFGSDRPEYMGVGNEYLLYINGETGEPYGWDGSENWTPMAYPLPQFEKNENYGDAGIWGDLGHRMQKHYFGAPYFDGRNPSIFLGRGCYTRHKFCALDVNPTTHELTQRWRWNCYEGNSPWFGNGFHNFAIGDVDMDGRDEIIFGSMMIDDTGYGLATTGYGHGDAAHCSDLDPYRWGLEQFVCLEGRDKPGVCYTNAASQTVYYQNGSGGDNGRAMAGNFQNTYPGGVGRSAQGGLISLASDKVIEGDAHMNGDDYWNMRIYWDGDLLSEFMDSPGAQERAPVVYKYAGHAEVGTGRTYANDRCWGGEGNLNNSSKNNPSFLGDILGDWREELVIRQGNSSLRIYISSYPSQWGITTLWADHLYRNGMTWQSVGYNQPPHPSFFLGELEEITNCPPALTLEGRTEVQNGGSITTTDDHLLVSGYEDKTIAVQDGASPYILTVNAPAWVKGSGGTPDESGAIFANASTPKQPERTIISYKTKLTGGAFSGATRLVKQGEGELELPNVVEKHTGETNIWQGTLRFDGTLEASPLWLNRHTTLISDGGKFLGGLKADYNATIYPGGQDKVGAITASTLSLGFGSRIVLDASNGKIDQINASVLTIEAKTAPVWKNYGPRYKSPILQINALETLASGTYELGTIGSVTGNISDLLLEGIDNTVKASLKYEDGKLLLVIEGMRSAGLVTWNGTSSNNTWQQAVSTNFLADDKETEQVFGDDVVFNDNAVATTLTIKGSVSPKSVTFDNETKNYTLSGDSIVGGGPITKNGKGTVTLNNWNHTGATTINKGILVVGMLANTKGQDWGALGNASQPIYVNDGATLRTNGTIITDQVLNISGEATVDVPSGKSIIFNKGIKGPGATLVKSGAGSMELGTQLNTFPKLIIKAGTVVSNHSSFNDRLPKTVEFDNGVVWGANEGGTAGNVANSTNFIVPKGKTGTFYGSYSGTHTGTLTGEGTFNAYTGGVRCYWKGDWSAFTGVVYAGKQNRQNKPSYDPVFSYYNNKGLPNATLNVRAEVTVSNTGPKNGDSSFDIPVGAVAGSGTLAGNGTWILGTKNTDFSIGTLTVNAKVEKRGTGKMSMTAGKMNGALTVSEGTVAFNDPQFTTLLHGTAATTVRNGGRIVGQGLLNALTLLKGSELIPCGSSYLETSPGTIKCNGTVSVNEGAVINFLVNSSKNSTLQAKTLTMNGTVKVSIVAERELKAGDELKLWTVSGTFSGTPKFDLPAGYVWDTSRINEGVLVVKDIDTGISTALADKDACNVYDLRGHLVSRQATATSTEGLASGVYLRGGRKVIVK